MMGESQGFTFGGAVRQCGVVCSDGLELLGFASDNLYIGSPRQVVLFLPGQFDNAYQQPKNRAILRATVDAEIGCIIANTRGQDYCSYHRSLTDASPSGYGWVRVGSSYERVSEASRDIEAWYGLATALAPDARIAIVGHSHGAVKIADSVLDRTIVGDTRQLGGICLLSPSDDIGSQRVALADRYDEAVALAASMVDDDKADVLMPDWAYAAPMSAGTYFEAFGPDSPLSAFTFHDPDLSPLREKAELWTAPTLAVFGSDDLATGRLSSAEACQVIEALLPLAAPLTTAVLPNTNHHYQGSEDALADLLVTWMAALLAE